MDFKGGWASFEGLLHVVCRQKEYSQDVRRWSRPPKMATVLCWPSSVMLAIFGAGVTPGAPAAQGWPNVGAEQNMEGVPRIRAETSESLGLGLLLASRESLRCERL